MPDLAKLEKFAQRYAEAWCGHIPEEVAAFFAQNGSISVNGGPSEIGRAAIADVAHGFFRDFPDMIVTFDKLEAHGDRIAFHWTLIGTNTGPGGTGNRVKISGYELWKINDDGLILDSLGHFDAADYARQLTGA